MTENGYFLTMVRDTRVLKDRKVFFCDFNEFFSNIEKKVLLGTQKVNSVSKCNEVFKHEVFNNRKGIFLGN